MADEKGNLPPVRFVRRLIAGNRARRTASGARLEGGRTKSSVTAAQLRLLESRGIVECVGDRIYPSAEAGNWLRRQLSEPGDFTSQHRAIEVGANGMATNRLANALHALATPRNGGAFLLPHHVEAAGRVCVWGEKANLRQRVIMSYADARVAGKHTRGRDMTAISDMALDARRSLARLFDILPHDCAGLLFDVCVFDKGLQQIERERAWPRRSAKLVLRIALEQLAADLGLGAKARGPRAGPTRSWLGAGARPHRFE